MYLNKFDFLNNAVGIKTASYTYFGCEPKDLKIEQAATLIGMCKNPSLYNPVRLQRAFARTTEYSARSNEQRPDISQRKSVIRCRICRWNWYITGWITKKDLATYFREYLRGVMTASINRSAAIIVAGKCRSFMRIRSTGKRTHCMAGVRRIRRRTVSNYNIYTDGLKIYTTINSRMQQLCRGCSGRACWGVLATFVLQREERTQEGTVQYIS